jgi:peptidoglycan/xylan/chitin deacetylase (PgdA/CDA1 family)
VRWSLLAAARPGAILILHEGDPARAYTLEVLDALLPELARRGYRVTSASDLIGAA